MISLSMVGPWNSEMNIVKNVTNTRFIQGCSSIWDLQNTFYMISPPFLWHIHIERSWTHAYKVLGSILILILLSRPWFLHHPGGKNKM